MLSRNMKMPYDMLGSSPMIGFSMPDVEEEISCPG
jgi:hypothetical protein